MDKYYVSGCKDNGSEIETCDDSEATFWTLYERKEDGLSHALLDCTDRLGAECAMAVYKERDQLQEQVKALAAENVALKQAFSPHVIPEDAVNAFNDTAIMDHDWNDTGEWSWVENDTDVIRSVLAELAVPEIPATDAAIREIKAQGVDEAINSVCESGSQTFGDCIAAMGNFAAQLRAKPEGEQP